MTKKRLMRVMGIKSLDEEQVWDMMNVTRLLLVVALLTGTSVLLLAVLVLTTGLACIPKSGDGIRCSASVPPYTRTLRSFKPGPSQYLIAVTPATFEICPQTRNFGKIIAKRGVLKEIGRITMSKPYLLLGPFRCPNGTRLAQHSCRKAIRKPSGNMPEKRFTLPCLPKIFQHKENTWQN